MSGNGEQISERDRASACDDDVVEAAAGRGTHPRLSTSRGRQYDVTTRSLSGRRARRAGVAATIALGVALAGLAAPARAATLIDTIDLGSNIYGIALAPDRSELWVTVNNADWTINDVAIIDPETNAIVDRFEVEVRPRGLAFTPDGSTVYVLSTFSNTAVPDAVLQAYSVATRDPVGAPIVVGNQGNSVVISPDGARAYVSNFGFSPTTGGTVSVVDLATSAVAFVPVGTNPSDLALTPSGDELWVVVQGAASVAVIDTATSTVTATIPTSGNTPQRIAISDDGTRAYVTGFSQSVVDVFDVETRTLLESIPTQTGPNDVVVTPDQATAYVSRFLSSPPTPTPMLTRIDLATGEREEFDYPASVGSLGTLFLDAVGGRLYATESGASGTRLAVLEVDAVIPPPEEEPAPELAETGVEAVPGIVFAILLALSGALLLAVRIGRRAVRFEELA